MTYEKQLGAYFMYLDDLRASGAINMYGAPDDLYRDHDVTMGEAREICKLWRDTFDPERTIADRVSAAINRGHE